MSLALRPVPPFDLSLSLAFLRGFGPMVGEQSATATSLTKAFDLGGQGVAVRVRQKGDRERPTLDVDLYSERALGAGLWRQVLVRVRALLSTDEDLAPFHALAAADPAMAPLLARLRGLHHVKFPSAFEAACWGVINQRIQLRAARAMKAALVRRAGTCATVDGTEHWAFPGPEAVLGLGEEELAKLLPGGRRAVAIQAVARAFASSMPRGCSDGRSTTFAAGSAPSTASAPSPAASSCTAASGGSTAPRWCRRSSWPRRR